MQSLENSVVAIVGLGLMGGSLALCLKEKRRVKSIIGITRRRATLNMALARGAIDQASDDLAAAHAADLIVLATPVRTLLQQIGRLGEIAADGALITDLGSTKSRIVQAMNQLPSRLFAVGSHPMCGKESSGFEVAEAGLYQDKVWVLTRTERSTNSALQLTTELAQAVGSRVILLDAARHDQLVAATSHLPFVVASNLMNAVAEWAGDSDDVWEVAASGFRDTTRLAASDTQMMLDILLTNSENVADLMRRYSRHFADLADMIYDQDEKALRGVLEHSAQQRRELISRVPGDPSSPSTLD